MSLSEQHKQLIENSIERVADVAGDPSPLVYARLFAEQPEMEPLFILDRDGSAQGHMLAEALDCVFDLLGPPAAMRTRSSRANSRTIRASAYRPPSSRHSSAS